MDHLNEYKKSYYSQFGEEGILEEIFERLDISTEWRGIFCEFGAWDGKHLSNTYYFYKEKGWTGLYIEADPEKIRDLYKNIPDENIKKENSLVEIAGENSLDNIFQRNNMPKEIDLLSIDIDSDDYAVWENFVNYSSKVVVIEINPSIPMHIEYIQKAGSNKGNSARAMYNLGIAKGYSLVASTKCNLFFVKKSLCSKLKIQEDLALESVFTPSACLFMTYDGKVERHNSESVSHLWTGQEIVVLPVKRTPIRRFFISVLKVLHVYPIAKLIYRKFL